MNVFTLELRSALAADTLEDVTDFVGEDAGGSFGLRARHERFMTSLVFGMARLRRASGAWEYLALPGALLYFVDNTLWIATARYERDSDYERVNTALTSTLVAEAEQLQTSRESLSQLEEALLRRLRELGRQR